MILNVSERRRRGDSLRPRARKICQKWTDTYGGDQGQIKRRVDRENVVANEREKREKAVKQTGNSERAI